MPLPASRLVGAASPFAHLKPCTPLRCSAVHNAIFSAEILDSYRPYLQGLLADGMHNDVVLKLHTALAEEMSARRAMQVCRPLPLHAVLDSLRADIRREGCPDKLRAVRVPTGDHVFGGWNTDRDRSPATCRAAGVLTESSQVSHEC